LKRPLLLLVIGGVAAGTKAAAKTRRDDPTMEITIITQEEYISYAGCGLAYYLGGVVDEREKLFARSPEIFREKHNINVLLNHRAERINSYDRTVKVVDLLSGETITMPYDRLLIATGASPIIPLIEGIDSQGIFTLHTIPDADNIINYINNGNVRDACIVGGGYIGVEAAENLVLRGISCTLFEIEKHLMPKFFDSDMSESIREHMKSKGVQVITGNRVDKFTSNSEGYVTSVVSDGKDYECQLVILATGVRPNVQLAKDARITIGSTGGIKVDRRMETSMRNIFAAGDCAESVNLVTGKPCWYPLGTTANKQGRVAGANIAGGKKIFEGVVGTSITKVFDITAGRTGLSEREATEAGFNTVSVTVTTSVSAGYYPGKGSITLKLIADSGRKILLGAQAVGDASVDKVIDTVAAALTGKLSIPALTNIDLAYSPPYSSVLGTVITAAGVLEEKLGL